MLLDLTLNLPVSFVLKAFLVSLMEMSIHTALCSSLPRGFPSKAKYINAGQHQASLGPLGKQAIFIAYMTDTHCMVHFI